jgi:GTP-binding protein Era
MTATAHKSGFVSIVGKPNVGKSTLMNKLVGENLSIITSKAQTTRHRIMGILNGEDFQIVYSDTPGMMHYVTVSLEDADVILLVVELGEKLDENILARFRQIKTPIVLVINKIDLGKGSQVDDKITYWKENLTVAHILTVSAKTGENVNQIIDLVKQYLPEHPGYYPKDTLTDRYERFFAAEIIREKIFLNYEQEIPYSTEVSIDEFKDDGKLIKMRATLFVERDSQKGILIGKAGSSLKKVGTEARMDLEEFFKRKVFLETHVKVAENWRKQKLRLKQFGYIE